jgi:two-component system chemotaxis sensor kinase CheA
MSPSDEEIFDLVRQESGDCLQRMETNLLALESGGGGAEEIDAILRDAHSIKGSSAMVGWQEVARLASAIEDHMQQARAHGALPSELVDPLLRALDALAKALGGEVGAAQAPIAELDLLARASNGAARKSDSSKPATEQPAVARTRAEPASTGTRPTTRTAPTGTTPTIKVPATKVDTMLEVVGETVLYHRGLEHELGPTLDDGRRSADVLATGERLLDGLQDSVVQMRTLPLSTITAPFPRAIRDLAAQEGKEVELVLTGAETQLDRVILDGISETIVHVLRNAVAHGIESPQQRVQAGKSRVGRIELHAEPRGGMVAITIADDGRGVSPELLARAQQGGSLVEILAKTGFSTAEALSDTAGRGVGLDAVKLHLDSLSGALDISSESGRGTEVTLLLPVTLALMQVLLFEWDDRVFALPMSSVGRVIAVTRTTSLGGLRSVELDGEAVPFASLGELIGAGSGAPAEHPPAIVLESPARRVAIACDALCGEEQVVIKSLGPLLATVPGYLGAAILGDGRIALVLDPIHLMKAPIKASAEQLSSQEPEARRKRVLVVDDQFAARELQRGILETAGYEVEVARDGRDALRQIDQAAELDLVLTDIQMPEMDGFELLEAIRSDQAHSSLPVVVVTTLADEDSRRRGASAGADAYVVKQDYDQEALLQTIERLVGT